jgi:hypothetical protein
MCQLICRCRYAVRLFDETNHDHGLSLLETQRVRSNNS